MFDINIHKCLKRFLKHIFCGVGANSPYDNSDFAHLLSDAAEHQDFLTNTSKRVDGPTGETLFNRLDDTSLDKIKAAFYFIMTQIFPLIKRFMRNRKFALAFDITDQPYFGKITGFWIHTNKPVRGSKGCFKYLTVSIVDGNERLIMGSLPIRIGQDLVALILELLQSARKFIQTETILFDRGFDNYRLVEALQKMGIQYQILWRKDKWTNKILKKMKRNGRKEVIAMKAYTYTKSKHKVKVRFVLIKGYKRYKNSHTYNWVFVTNIRRRWNHLYVDKYKMRWGIETVFRVLDGIEIKTTTRNEIYRYFLNIFCCILYNLWKCAKMLGCILTLKNFVAKIVADLRTNCARIMLMDSS